MFPQLDACLVENTPVSIPGSSTHEVLLISATLAKVGLRVNKGGYCSSGWSRLASPCEFTIGLALRELSSKPIASVVPPGGVRMAASH